MATMKRIAEAIAHIRVGMVFKERGALSEEINELKVDSLDRNTGGLTLALNGNRFGKEPRWIGLPTTVLDPERIEEIAGKIEDAPFYRTCSEETDMVVHADWDGRRLSLPLCEQCAGFRDWLTSRHVQANKSGLEESEAFRFWVDLHNAQGIDYGSRLFQIRWGETGAREVNAS